MPMNATTGANNAHSTHGSDTVMAPDAVCSAGALEAVPEGVGTTALGTSVDAAGTNVVFVAGARVVVGPPADV